MKITRDIEITVKIVLEIETDAIGDDIHGGVESPDEIADEAIAHYVTEMDYSFLSIEGIKVIRTEVQSYNQ